MNKLNALLVFLVLFLVGCGGIDSDLLGSGKTHLENITKVSAKLKDSPDDEKLESQLKNHILYFKAVVDSAGEGNKSKLQDKLFEGMTEAESKAMFKLIYGTY